MYSMLCHIFQAPAGLFQKASHYSDFQPMPSSRPFKLKFHSSAVAPSPSTSNQSKSSLDGAVRSTEAIIPMSPKVIKSYMHDTIIY